MCVAANGVAGAPLWLRPAVSVSLWRSSDENIERSLVMSACLHSNSGTSCTRYCCTVACTSDPLPQLASAAHGKTAIRMFVDPNGTSTSSSSAPQPRGILQSTGDGGGTSVMLLSRQKPHLKHHEPQCEWVETNKESPHMHESFVGFGGGVTQGGVVRSP